ncbi:type IV pilus assembly PilZ [Pseudodesulfovibrio mercurii]|uniref:Type IV pilus assembly PilZ n=1 Tax=Pseudodesulfovibrio mercurii TaxID=641491 RepID=F0JHC8_9BACT|nr:flagellar brake protein [Pseudodesulfovibrio mercurii]EGB15243.1 type IV pilus assembly PilZ [Pseudodesulfovibrio mercurii]
MPDKAQKETTASIAPAETKVLTMPGVQLRVSLGKDVVIRVPGADHSYRGRIVGFDPYDYLIASVRLPGRIRRQLALGGQMIVKYIHQGTIYGFRTTAYNTVTSPTSLVFFAYPSVIEKVELRRDTRTECNIDGALQAENGEYECLIVNISATGCKVSVRARARDPIARLKVGDTLVAIVNLGTEGTLKLPIVVRNIQREQGLHTIGAMFLDLNEAEEERIGNYLKRMRRLTRQPTGPAT